ncbi:FAD/NAD(P)-binding protein [Ketogulonicigenium vulgare]|nr:FAD/NAD(P)-binding protein [Ketogulonicigenium vulgare]
MLDRTEGADAKTALLIIGGGASGVLLAAHVLHHMGDAPKGAVTIVEPTVALGQGIAYATTDPDHLLNTRVHNMSAFPDQPHHFADWLAARPAYAGYDDHSFVPRMVYGAYLADLVAAPLADGRLIWRRARAVALREGAAGVVARLDDGASLVADRAVLATGHVVPGTGDGLAASAWDNVSVDDQEGRVVIIGSGLSMVDQVLSLLKSGHRGPIVTVSRRGQMPRPHRPAAPLEIAESDVPFGGTASQLFAFARAQARRAEAQGGTWRDAVDGIRPYVRRIWASLDLAARKRLLKHADVWWDVHRHRIPEASDTTISAAMARGQLTQLRAAYLGAERSAGQVIARLRPRGQRDEISLPAAAIIDCRGIRNDPAAHASPLMADLFGQGVLRVDPLGISPDVDADCHLRGKDGTSAAHILAVGPVTRSAFWEITAVPDIRSQTWQVAQDIAPLLVKARI